MIPLETRKRHFRDLGLYGSLREEWDFYFDHLEAVFAEDQEQRLEAARQGMSYGKRVS